MDQHKAIVKSVQVLYNNRKVLINKSYVCSQHSPLCVFNAIVLDKKIICVILYGVSQFNRFNRALEVSLLFTRGLQVAKMLLLK